MSILTFLDQIRRMQDYAKEPYFTASRKGSQFLLQWFRTYEKKKKKKKKEVKTIKERTLNGPRRTEVDRLDQMNQSNGCF